MTDAWIDWYMDWLDRQPCRYFWSDNYFANALTNMREGHNSWSPRPSPRWQLIHSKLYLSARNSAEMLFIKDGEKSIHKSDQALKKGAEAWITCLERARCQGDELSLRRALEFAQSYLPFVPKEAWQIAKTLSGMTGSAREREIFQNLDQIRKGGNEGGH